MFINMDLALNNQQRLIYHKSKPSQPKHGLKDYVLPCDTVVRSSNHVISFTLRQINLKKVWTLFSH